MKNFLKLFLFTLLFLHPFCFAQDELLEKFKSYRSSMYLNLNLKEEQKEQISKIDNAVFEKLSPHTQKISSLTDELRDIIESEDIQMEQINQIKQEFDNVDEQISLIKTNYEKEFEKILTPKQKILYKSEKRKLRKNLKKEMKKLKD